jgi:transposase
MKSDEHSQLTSLANTRDRLVKLRTVLKNKIHNILAAHGIPTKREAYTSERELTKVLTLELTPVAKVELGVIVEQIRHLNEGIATLEQELIDRGKKLKGYENITSIKGIGPKSGTILLSVIGNPADFATEKQLGAYFGIVPRVANSHETIRQGHITKCGSALGRTTLVQCTLIAIRYSPYLRRFYQRLKVKKGSGKAIIATARKLLGIIYQTLKNKWVFEDFPNFVLKQA